jgi:hypothetical protein
LVFPSGQTSIVGADTHIVVVTSRHIDGEHDLPENELSNPVATGTTMWLQEQIYTP